MIGATDDVVLVREMAQLDGQVVALDPDDGTELWRWQSPAAQRAPGSFVGSDIVVLLTGDAGAVDLVGVDVMTGAERWRIAEQLTVLGSTDDVIAVERFSDVMGSEPVRGIDRGTGTELWVSDVAKLDMSGVYGGTGTSAIWQHSLIVPTDATSTALDMATGAVLWASSSLGTPLEADDVVIGARLPQGPSAAVTGVDPNNGDELWSHPGQPAYGGYVAVGDGIVVVSQRDAPGLIAYEQTSGAERWRTESANQAHRISGDKVISLWEEGLDARATIDGSVVWQLVEPFGSPYMNDVVANSTAAFTAINSLPWSD
jgi:outer membrane protein assembly factor BamB